MYPPPPTPRTTTTERMRVRLREQDRVEYKQTRDRVTERQAPRVKRNMWRKNAMATGERMRQWTHSERPSPKGAREAQPGRDE